MTSGEVLLKICKSFAKINRLQWFCGSLFKRFEVESKEFF
ncbi:hypothetical protein MHD_01495 [Mannheimia granulomatis]|uniref:Uncharacterized protein n=1 Tax=Mannheimia granulomatis TaxID=85402 RepID=A0A011NCL8_9PAST|nr:hypothetical protein AK33_08205 [Mannheimia granulomatis]RGE48643.1 hypothetical protein MHD_01495 [Mannheimia granulomatis]